MSDTIHDTNNMTERTQKLRAVVLAALMVLSVIAMGTAFVGTAAAGPDDVKSNGYKINVGSDELINESSTQDLEVPEGSINDLTFVIDDQLSSGQGDGEFAFELTFQDDLSLSDTSDVVDIEIVNDARGDTVVLTSSVVDNVALVNFTSGSTAGSDDQLIVKFTVTDVQSTTGPVSSDDDITTDALDRAGSDSVIIPGVLGIAELDGTDIVFPSATGEATDRDGDILQTNLSLNNGEAGIADQDANRVYLGEEGILFYNNYTPAQKADTITGS